MKEDLHITFIQNSLEWENKKANLEKFGKQILELNEATDLIVLPEMFTTGFTMNAASMAETMTGPSVEWLKEMSLKKNCTIVGSLIIKEEERFYNRLVWMTPRGYTTYDKRHLFSYSGEDKTYSMGRQKIIKEIKGWRILPLVCYDLRFPVWSRRTRQEDYELLIYVANWPERRAYAWRQLLIARAIENQSYVCGLNRVGNDGNGIYHSGDSALLNYRGEKISGESSGNELMQTHSLKMNELIGFREQFAFFNDGDSFQITS